MTEEGISSEIQQPFETEDVAELENKTEPKPYPLIKEELNF